MPIDISVSTHHTIISTDGGISMPRQALPATAAEREIAPIAIAAHFRIGDARERGGGGDAHAGDEAEQRIAQDRRDGEPAGQPAAQPVGERIDVARGAAFGEKVAHQHEQRDDGEHVVAQRLIGGVGDEGAHHLDVAHHQVDAERGGDAERDRDVHAGKHQRQHHDDNNDHIEMAEHGAASSNMSLRPRHRPPPGRTPDRAAADPIIA